MRRAGVGGHESGMGAADLAAAASDWSGMGSQTLPASGGGEELGEEVEMMMGGWVGGREEKHKHWAGAPAQRGARRQGHGHRVRRTRLVAPSLTDSRRVALPGCGCGCGCTSAD